MSVSGSPVRYAGHERSLGLGFEHDLAPSRCAHQGLIMSGDDDRDTDFVKALEQAHNLGGQRRIQIASGLISHEQGRFAHDCARDAHALLLTDRQFERRDALPAEQSDLIERGAYTLVDLLE